MARAATNTCYRAPTPRHARPAPLSAARGGKSTGPTTATGLARSRRARWKHGAYSREMREMRARVRRSQEDLRALDARTKALGIW